MKEIKSIVSGVAVTGKVGDYIFYNRLGVPCVRRANLRRKDPGTCTPGQRISQDRMRYLVSLYKALKGTSVGQAWRLARKRPGQTGFNAFVSRNYAAFGKDEVIADYARVKMSEGDLRLPLGISAAASGPKAVTLEWATDDDKIMGRSDDRLHVLLMAGDGSFRVAVRDTLSVCRGDGRAVVCLIADEGLPEHLYCFWASADGSRFSPSWYTRIAWK